MKAHSKTWLSLTILFFVIHGCTTKEIKRATITIKNTSLQNTVVKITIGTYLDEKTLLDSKTDSTGAGSFDVVLQEPILAGIQIGKKYGEVYLSPGFNLVINQNGDSYKTPLTFSGTGADVNNYVSWINSNVEKIKWANGKGLADLDIDAFLHRFDSLKNTIREFHEHYLDSVTLTGKVVSMLDYKNSIKLLEVQQEYKFYRLNDEHNEKAKSYENGQTYLEGKVYKELESFTNEIPLDTTLLAQGWHDYQMLLNYYWYNEIYLKLADEFTVHRNLKANRAPLMSYALIEKGNFPNGIREFLIAYDFSSWLTDYGITPETDSVFASIKRNYPKSNYLRALDRNYAEWQAVAPGKPAPEFEGYSPEGKKVSINDLRGKIVYIDVWATWCGPCLGEIPASKKLQEELKNEDRIQFLNVSVDSRRSDWEQFLMKDKNWKGLHIIIDRDMIQHLYETYKLSGVPGYILIDRSGDIITMRASRPSEGKIGAEIRQLLAKRL